MGVGGYGSVRVGVWKRGSSRGGKEFIHYGLLPQYNYVCIVCTCIIKPTSQ